MKYLNVKYTLKESVTCTFIMFFFFQWCHMHKILYPLANVLKGQELVNKAIISCWWLNFFLTINCLIWYKHVRRTPRWLLIQFGSLWIKSKPSIFRYKFKIYKISLNSIAFQSLWRNLVNIIIIHVVNLQAVGPIVFVYNWPSRHRLDLNRKSKVKMKRWVNI